MSRDSSVSHSATALPVVIPLTQDLALSDGAIGEQTAELVDDVLNPQHFTEATLVAEDPAAEDDQWLTLPWWRRPNPMWILASVPFTAAAFAGSMAPKIEIYTELVCKTLRPDIILTPSLSEAVITAGRCAAEPNVQAAVAKLSTLMTGSMGVLTCLTSAWWGSFADRHGRTSVMGITLIGLLLTDVNFIIIYNIYESIPGGYWLLLIGPLVEGSLGGMLSALAANNAYLTDTTSPLTRSRTFSLSLGLLFIGMAVGPTLGSLLIEATNKPIAVIYASSVIHFLYALYVWFIVPESLAKKRMQAARVSYKEALEKELQERRDNPAAWLAFGFKRFFKFLTPLAVLAPQQKPDAKGTAKRNWSLVLVCVGYAFTISIMGSYPFKFQYAAQVFGWNSKKMGYWLSLIGATRAVYLTVVLPIIISAFKPKQPVALNTNGDNEPLLSPTQSQTPQTHHHHSVRTDLWLARVSMTVELFSYTLMGAIIHPLGFTVFAMMGAFGSGFSPAIHSLAVEIYSHGGGSETGKLFGALSVVQALSSQIIGPALYGLVYVRTVAVFPGAMFFVSSVSLALGLIMLAFVKVPSPSNARDEEEEGGIRLERDTALIDDTPDDGEGTSTSLNKVPSRS